VQVATVVVTIWTLAC